MKLSLMVSAEHSRIEDDDSISMIQTRLETEKVEEGLGFSSDEGIGAKEAVAAICAGGVACTFGAPVTGIIGAAAGAAAVQRHGFDPQGIAEYFWGK